MLDSARIETRVNHHAVVTEYVSGHYFHYEVDELYVKRIEQPAMVEYLKWNTHAEQASISSPSLLDC